MIPHTWRSSLIPANGRKCAKHEKPGLFAVPPSSERSAELLLHERADASTERGRRLVRLGLGEDPHHGLGPGRPHEHAAVAGELVVDALDLARMRSLSCRRRRRGRSASPAGSVGITAAASASVAAHRGRRAAARGEPVPGDVAVR
jgi:hypothetical protein